MEKCLQGSALPRLSISEHPGFLDVSGCVMILARRLCLDAIAIFKRDRQLSLKLLQPSFQDLTIPSTARRTPPQEGSPNFPFPFHFLHNAGIIQRHPINRLMRPNLDKTSILSRFPFAPRFPFLFTVREANHRQAKSLGKTLFKTATRCSTNSNRLSPFPRSSYSPTLYQQVTPKRTAHN